MTLNIGRRRLLGMTALAGLSLANPRIAGAAASPSPVVATGSGPVSGRAQDGVFNDSPAYRATHLVTYGRMFAGSVQIAERKAAQGGAKAYMYRLEWRTPVGPFRAPHALEVPLVFDNVENARVLVGPGPEPEVVAKQMSAAWAAFAHTGNPNTSVLPRWPAYDATWRPVMVFNLQSRVVDDLYSATRQAVT